MKPYIILPLIFLVGCGNQLSPPICFHDWSQADQSHHWYRVDNGELCARFPPLYPSEASWTVHLGNGETHYFVTSTRAMEFIEKNCPEEGRP